MSNDYTNNLEPRVAQLEKDTTKIMSMIERVTNVTQNLASSHENIQKELKESRSHQELMFAKIHDRLTESDIARGSLEGNSLRGMVDAIIGGVKLLATIIVIVSAVAASVLYLAGVQSERAATLAKTEITTELDKQKITSILNEELLKNHNALISQNADINNRHTQELIKLDSRITWDITETNDIKGELNKIDDRITQIEHSRFDPEDRNQLIEKIEYMIDAKINHNP